MGTPEKPGWDWCGQGTSHVAFTADEKLPVEEDSSRPPHRAGESVYVIEGMKEVVLLRKRRLPEAGVTNEILEEINALENLKHVHIAKLVGSYTQDGTLGLLFHPTLECNLATVLNQMDRLVHLPDNEENQADLAELMKRLGRDFANPKKSCTELCMQSLGCVSEAVVYLHQKGIRHRNLAPTNILLGPDDEILITGFGVTSQDPRATSDSSEQTLYGVSRYVAPEVSPTKDVRFSADVFSLGGIFFDVAALCNGLVPKAPRKKKGTENKKETEIVTKIDVRAFIKSSFRKDINAVSKWLDKESSRTTLLTECQFILAQVRMMLRRRPESRPLAAEVTRALDVFVPPQLECCSTRSFLEELQFDFGYRNEGQRAEDMNQYHQYCFFVDYKKDHFKDVEIKEVVFFLHPSWAEPQKVCTKPPYAVYTSSWGGVPVKIAVFLKYPAYWKYRDDETYRLPSEPIILDIKLEPRKSVRKKSRKLRVLLDPSRLPRPTLKPESAV